MRHGMQGRHFSRSSSHRQAMFDNLATALLKHGRITTTLPKAKDLRRVVEPLITLAKKGDLAARRQAARTINESEVLKHLFDTLGPLMKDRKGGYTRILKIGFRKGDAAPMALIELTDQPEAAAPAKKAAAKPAAKKETTKAAAPKAEAKKAAPKKAAAATTEKVAKPAAKKAPAKKTTKGDK